MFLVMFVYAPVGGGSQITISNDALELTVQAPSLLTPPPDMGPHWTGSPTQLHPLLDMEPHWKGISLASDIWWPSLETCLNLFTLEPPD